MLYFSLGECRLSLSSPKPMNTILTPSSFSKIEQIGMEPPPRTGIGSLPNVVAMALAAALYAVLLMGVMYGSPPWCSKACTVTEGGAIFRKWLNSRLVIFAEDCLGTRR